MLIDDTENYFKLYSTTLFVNIALLLYHTDSLARKLRKKTLHFAHDPCSDLSRFITRAETFFRFAGVWHNLLTGRENHTRLSQARLNVL